MSSNPKIGTATAPEARATDIASRPAASMRSCIPGCRAAASSGNLRIAEGTSSAAFTTSFIHFADRTSSTTFTVPAGVRSVAISATRSSPAPKRDPSPNQVPDGGVCRSTTPERNIAAAISMTQPSVRSAPTTRATSSTVIPFWTPTTRLSGCRSGRISSVAHAVSYAFVTSRTMSKRSLISATAQMNCSGRGHHGALRHLHRDARASDRLDVRRPLIDDRHVGAGVDEVCGDAGTVRSGTEYRDPHPQARQTLLRLQNSRMPSAESSRPIPESLTPPKGSSG